MTGGNGLSIETSEKGQKRTSASTSMSSGDADGKKKRTATLLDLDVIDCSVCFDTLTIPIFQCDNGHIACAACIEKLRKRCATCSLPTLSRNRAMERVLEVLRGPCPNAGFGCSEDVSYAERSTHLEQCAFTPCPCPFNSCNFTGSYKDLYEHSVAKHLESLDMFECGEPVFLQIENGERVVLKEQTTEGGGGGGGGELVVAECFSTPLGRMISVSCIAPEVLTIGNFSYSLKLRSSSGANFYFEFNVKKVCEVSGEPPDKDFVLLPAYLWPYKLFICINRKTS